MEVKKAFNKVPSKTAKGVRRAGINLLRKMFVDHYETVPPLKKLDDIDKPDAKMAGIVLIGYDVPGKINYDVVYINNTPLETLFYDNKAVIRMDFPSEYDLPLNGHTFVADFGNDPQVIKAGGWVSLGYYNIRLSAKEGDNILSMNDGVLSVETSEATKQINRSQRQPVYKYNQESDEKVMEMLKYGNITVQNYNGVNKADFHVVPVNGQTPNYAVTALFKDKKISVLGIEVMTVYGLNGVVEELTDLPEENFWYEYERLKKKYLLKANGTPVRYDITKHLWGEDFAYIHDNGDDKTTKK